MIELCGSSTKCLFEPRLEVVSGRHALGAGYPSLPITLVMMES